MNILNILKKIVEIIIQCMILQSEPGTIDHGSSMTNNTHVHSKTDLVLELAHSVINRKHRTNDTNIFTRESIDLLVDQCEEIVTTNVS